VTHERNMDLIRDTLLEIEGGRRAFNVLPMSEAKALMVPEDEAMEDQAAKALEYHLGLIENAGFAEFRKAAPATWFVEGLTWGGHEFLDNIRAQDVWDQAKEQAANLGGFSMELLGDLAKGFVKTKIAKHTGVDL